MSLPALQVDASQFQRKKKSLKTELAQVTSTNSPLNPLFSKIPHEREMSLAKKVVWRELTECYTQATEQTGFRAPQKGHKEWMWEMKHTCTKRVKTRPCKVVIYAACELELPDAWPGGHCVEFRFNKLRCLRPHGAQTAEDRVSDRRVFIPAGKVS